MVKNVKDLMNKLDTTSYLKMGLHEWRELLAKECQVYVFDEGYIAKRFDQIHFKICRKNEAKEVLVDNLYALLRFKYFTTSSEEVDNRIKDIVNSFVANLKTTLIRVSFDLDADCEKIEFIPSYCIAFRNGVYDFLHAKWLFMYDIVSVTSLSNKIYMYDNRYAIFWYVNIDFEPLDLKITDLSLEEFVSFMKNFTSINRNYCFELMYNMSHNFNHEFSLDKFKHLCEVIGYLIAQEFLQKFVYFVGSGQNGKNSLFDGCFVSKVVPRPAANDLDAIESDKFITGALENKSHNIFLESSPKTYTESKMIKALTGSMYQTIEQKGVDKYSSIINCKYLFSANDQDKVKFSDTTPGFTRRINIFEVFYKWDEEGRYLKKGDYYNTVFSDSFSEIKNDSLNAIVFIYFGMYGLLSATHNFTKNFNFNKNDWKLSYADIDFDLKDRIEDITISKILAYINSSKTKHEECKVLLYDCEKNRLYNSSSLQELGYNSYEDMLKMFSDGDAYNSYFAENDVYINIRILQKICSDLSSPTQFTQALKKMYGLTSLQSFYNNQPYIKVTFIGGKLMVRK